MSENINEARRLLRKEAKKLTGKLKDERTRARGPIVRQLHEIQKMLMPSYTYSSQAGQDAVVDQLMKRMRGGTFVDVGGYDGVTGSNTLFLEGMRGWSGLLVEPVGSQIERAKQNRACPCLQIAVADEAGQAEFIEITEGYTQMSGLAKTYDASLLKTVRNDKRHKETIVQVETKPLSDVLRDADLMNPDFISLDIEGGELSCLSSFPFEDHDVKIWAIENNTGTPEIKTLMEAKGYDLIEFCGPDEIYFKRSP